MPHLFTVAAAAVDLVLLPVVVVGKVYFRCIYIYICIYLFEYIYLFISKSRKFAGKLNPASVNYQ